jgi:polyribonucleotide nucleotidyltransferase
VLESNGSSSMATVCGATLSMMDCGVPIRKPVAGIAMGLIKEGDKVAILSDILGDEDHLGDMDFKVCGTDRGVTAIQMDIKISGLSREILEQALAQAREGRLHILRKMLEVLPQPRAEINRWAPRITTVKVKPDQIRIVIGPGGKTIKGIIDQTGCSVDVNDDGTVAVAGSDPDAVRRAIDIIQGLTAEPEVGKVYKGPIKRLVDFGAFVEILPNTEALLHVSEIAHERIESPFDIFKEGDDVEVKVISVDREGRIRLTRRELLPLPEGEEGERAKERIARAREAGPHPSGGGGGDRGPRGGGGDRGPRGGGGDRGPRGGGGDRGPRGGGRF